MCLICCEAIIGALLVVLALCDPKLYYNKSERPLPMPPATHHKFHTKSPRSLPKDKKTTIERLSELYHILDEHYGDVGWWPGDSRFEVILGAILTQQTNWRNVEKALSELKKHGILTMDDSDSISNVLGADITMLSQLIRPTGFYKQKTLRILMMARYLTEEFRGDLECLAAEDTSTLRNSLLELKGIGNETADSILLYAFDKAVFVVDAYSFRLLERLGIYRDPKRNYTALQELFEESITHDVGIYKQYHGLIVSFSKELCRRKPLCENCFMKNSCQYHRDLSTNDV